MENTILNLHHDSSGRPIGYWCIADDHKKCEAAAEIARKSLGLDDSLGCTRNGIVGWAAYFVYVQFSDPHEFNQMALLEDLSDVAGSEARKLSDQLYNQYLQMPPAQRREYDRNEEEKRTAEYKEYYEEAFSRARWRWPTVEFETLYNEVRPLVINRPGWRNEHLRVLFAEVQTKGTLADKHQCIDAARMRLESLASRFERLLPAMEDQCCQMDDARARQEEHFCKRVKLGIRSLVDEFRMAAPRLDYVYQMRKRTIPTVIKDEVSRRDGNKCVVCGSREHLEFDHILLFSKGGDHAVDNLRLLCYPCHKLRHELLGDMPRVTTLTEAIALDAGPLEELKRKRRFPQHIEQEPSNREQRHAPITPSP